MMTVSPSLARRSAAGLLVLCCSLALAEPAGAAPLAPTIDRKYVCDWSFVSGPRAGQSGKESRRWTGSLPNLQASTWWPGRTATSVQTFTSPLGVAANPPTTRWNVSTPVDGAAVIGKVDVAAISQPHAQARRIVFHGFSNGASITCLELDPGALAWIHSTYAGGADQPNVCQCATGYHYDATVGCIERCAAYWNVGSRWTRLNPPACLGSPGIVAKAACLLSRDPAAGGPQEPIDFEDCQIDPSAPQCNTAPGGDGQACGAGGACQPGCTCTASNLCRCPQPPQP